jgi:2-dehydro-3-deoxyphosphooctonate aldolase (KDO 8-P synthase)
MMKLLDFEVGINQPFFLIAGPCVIESETLALETATYLQQVTEDLGINFIYKSSYDKANRTSTSSFRGLGIEEGLRILQKVKDEVGCKVLTDVHEDTPLDEVASWVSINSPLTPTAIAARARTGTISRCPPEVVPCPPGCCTE